MSESTQHALRRTRSMLEGYSQSASEQIIIEGLPNWVPIPLAELIKYSGNTQKWINKFTTRITLVCLVTGVAIVYVHPGALLVPFLWCGLECLILSKRSQQRAEHFEKDYPALLLSLASSVRTGMDPFFALCEAHQLFQPKSEMGVELRQFKRAIDAGMVEEGALQRFASSIAHPDIELFRAAFMLARRQGCSIAECLHRLARVTRQRQSFRRKIRAAVAMQKLSAFGIGGCVVIIGILQIAANPEAMRNAFAHPIGQKLLTLGLGLVMVGIGWMLALCRAR